MVKLKVYAQAFFEVALEANKVDDYMEEAKLVISAIKENDEFRKLLVHPEVSETKKLNLLNNVFADRVSKDFVGLFKIVVLKRRESFLIGILESFVTLCLEHKNMTVARVLTPVALNEVQQDKIKIKLKSMLGKDIILEVVIRPELISGFRIIADGAIIDTSFRKQMEDMRNAMYKNLAKEAVHGS